MHCTLKGVLVSLTFLVFAFPLSTNSQYTYIQYRIHLTDRIRWRDTYENVSTSDFKWLESQVCIKIREALQANYAVVNAYLECTCGKFHFGRNVYGIAKLKFYTEKYLSSGITPYFLATFLNNHMDRKFFAGFYEDFSVLEPLTEQTTATTTPATEPATTTLALGSPGIIHKILYVRLTREQRWLTTYTYKDSIDFQELQSEVCAKLQDAAEFYFSLEKAYRSCEVTKVYEVCNAVDVDLGFEELTYLLQDWEDYELARYLYQFVDKSVVRGISSGTFPTASLFVVVIPVLTTFLQ